MQLLSKNFILLIVTGLLVSFVTSGCSSKRRGRSAVVVDEVMAPLSKIIQAVAYALPGGVRASSENRRTYTSKYVDLKGNRWDLLGKNRHRAFVEVTILSDRRPYIIEISAFVEERETTDVLDQEFVEVGESRQLAEKVTKKLMFRLEDSRKGRNLIDDFRAF